MLSHKNTIKVLQRRHNWLTSRLAIRQSLSTQPLKPTTTVTPGAPGVPAPMDHDELELKALTHALALMRGELTGANALELVTARARIKADTLTLEWLTAKLLHLGVSLPDKFTATLTPSHTPSRTPAVRKEPV